ncbi:MAG: dTMP kinase [Candidatus Parvarchaeota archaeon]|nr:dTMP kinase [Candidatus Parvarchaeota archaeon]
MQGKLLVIEGIDGAGKSTQIKFIKSVLESSGFKTIIFSYPDKNSDYGKIIHSSIEGNKALTIGEQFLLYILDMVKDTGSIKKALESGSIVIADRYFFSTIAYQGSVGFGVGKSVDIIKTLGLNMPSMVFYLDIPVEMAIKRKQLQKGEEKTDMFEKNAELLERARKQYISMADSKLLCDNWVFIDASLQAQEVSAKIKETLKTVTEGKK